MSPVCTREEEREEEKKRGRREGEGGEQERRRRKKEEGGRRIEEALSVGRALEVWLRMRPGQPLCSEIISE